MEKIAEYVLRLVCASVLSSVLLSITGTSGSSGRIRQMLCGIFVAFVAISPLREINLRNISFPDTGIALQAERFVQAGTQQARSAMEEIIKEQCASYILSKAEELRLQPDITVELDPDTGVPVGITLSCTATPYEKSVLSDYLIQTLGIERSAIQWNP